MAENFTEVWISCLTFAYHSPLTSYLPSFSPTQLTTQNSGKWVGNHIPLKLQSKSYQYNGAIVFNQAKGMPNAGTPPVLDLQHLKELRESF